MSLTEFVEKTKALLDLEREAELEETQQLLENVSAKELEKKGICLLKLRAGARKTGLYGRSVITFESFWHGSELPSHSLSNGDIVGVNCSEVPPSSPSIVSGIISRVGKGWISVAFDLPLDELPIEDDVKYRLTKLANDITYKRLKQGLQELGRYANGPASRLINTLFGDLPTQCISAADSVPIKFFNPCLNLSQQEAVKFALERTDAAIIHGPPGTGKTTTVVETVLQLVARKEKILACAPSNVAVDNLVEKLSFYKCKIVRLGHPARLLEHIQKHCLDSILERTDQANLVADVRNDISKNLGLMRKSKSRDVKQQLRQDNKQLRKELRERERACLEHVLNSADVILSTLTTASSDGPLKHVSEGTIHTVVIDECSQATEVACWLALMHGKKCILAGDHHQLPPTIISHSAARQGLAVTLMERLIQLYGASMVTQLTRQYRMNELIMRWPSKQLYEDKLVADDSVAQHLLHDLAEVSSTEDTTIPLLLIDTAGCDMTELDLPEEVSKGNESEADLAAWHVQALIDAGIKAQDIAVIAPYNLQVEFLRLKLHGKHPSLEIKSVDGFQGREKEAVVITLVRSNLQHEIGFLAEDRRINVAITRARRHLAVICDSETVGCHEFLKELVTYMITNGEVRSAEQYRTALGQFECVQFPKHFTTETPPAGSRAVNAGAKVKVKNANLKQPGVTHSCVKTSATHMAKVLPTNSPEYDHIIATVEDFARGDSLEYRFPASLTSRQRMIVHETGQRLGLIHVSTGEGEMRQITLRKKSCMETQTSLNDGNKERDSETAIRLDECAKKPLATEDSLSERAYGTLPVEVPNVEISSSEEDEIGIDNTDIKCEKCQKFLPRSNIELHVLRCRDAKPSTPVKVKPSSGKKHKKSNKQKSPLTAASLPDDFDDMLEAVKLADNTCRYAKCKAKLSTLGQTCCFCGCRFCLSHHQPEVHGCGDEAKAHARMVIRKTGTLGGGASSKKPDPEKRANIERKLEKKLSELEQQRRQKKLEKKTK